MKFAHYITTLERDAPKEWKGKFLQYVSKVVVLLRVVNTPNCHHLHSLCLQVQETEENAQDMYR